MRLDDINAFIDAKRVYDRAYDRVFGMHNRHVFYADTLSQLREIASLTDKRMERTVLTSGDILWHVDYRGVAFEYIAASGEEE